MAGVSESEASVRNMAVKNHTLNHKPKRKGGKRFCPSLTLRVTTGLRILIAKIVLALLLCPIPGLAQQAPQTVDLRPTFKAGQISEYEIWTRREITSSISGHGRTQWSSRSMLLEGQVTWAVDKVHADGSATCSMTVDWITALFTPGEGPEQSNDSRQPSGDTEKLHMLLRAVAGVPVVVEVAANGRVEKILGADAIREQIDDPTIELADIDFMESASELALLTAAPDATEPSQRWQDRFTWRRELGMLEHDLTYELVKVETIAGIPVATISGTASLSLDVDTSKLPPDGPPLDIDLADGSLSTQIMFDLNRSEVVGRNSIETTHIRAERLLENVTISTTTEQTVQSQALRIVETDR